MRIYLQPPQLSRGLQRIADALTRYLPDGWEVVANEAEADLVVIYAIGRRDQIEKRCVDIWRRKKLYAIIQVCLRSTMSPRVDDWLQTPDKKLADEGFEGIWLNTHVIWSYYDLNQACVDDGWSLEHDGDSMWNAKQFYHAPLGADAEVFVADLQVKKRFTIATSGLSYLSESVRECWLAAQQVGGEVFHVGPARLSSACQTFSHGCTDGQLATALRQCEFVSGLRRKEGFELPAVEGLLCGSRPLVFDNPDWRFNYGNHALYLQEGSRDDVIDQLVQLFKHGAPPVTEEERQRAVERYDWKTIIGGFYERLK